MYYNKFIFLVAILMEQKKQTTILEKLAKERKKSRQTSIQSKANLEAEEYDDYQGNKFNLASFSCDQNKCIRQLAIKLFGEQYVKDRVLEPSSTKR